jgi:putative DNA primase/helicase
VQWAGYVLSGRTDLQKILLLIGPRRSGKGTIGRVLSAMIGKSDVAGPTLASLGTNFGLAPLIGKPLAIVSDARLAGADAHQVVERLLSVSGEDLLTIDRKYREPWTGYLPARFVVLSNELPRFGDASGAISTRFVILLTSQSFLGRENTRLTTELLGELPGILNWALDGWTRSRGTARLPNLGRRPTQGWRWRIWSRRVLRSSVTSASTAGRLCAPTCITAGPRGAWRTGTG